MMTAETMTALADALRESGVPSDRAEEYAALIGDTPEVDGGFVVIRDEDGREIDRVPAGVLE